MNKNKLALDEALDCLKHQEKIVEKPRVDDTNQQRCEFCLNEVDSVASTSFFCCYCVDCLKLVLSETKEALKSINRVIR